MHSPLAVISKKAKIGNNVTIGPFCVIHDDVEIGDNCNLHSHVVIYDGARIGSGNEFYPGAIVSAVPQDLKYKNETTYTYIGDNNKIREFVTINKGTIALGKTVIGSRNLLMAYVHVAHDCVLGNDCILANGVTLAGHITIDDYAIIGGLSAVHQFVHIGSHVMISGGSLVRKDVPPFTKSAHEPLAYVGLNAIGLRRRNFSSEQINNVQEIYRHLFVNGHTTGKAVKIIEAQIVPSEERDLILNFIKTSQRGLMKGYIGESEE
jgi:UDP-N-acetylglucosamine acyltransferase